MDLRPGDVIYGKDKSIKYEIIRPLGNGSFGLVFEIVNQAKERFALKTITTAWLEKTQLKSLLNEGKLSMKISHENILHVFFFHNGEDYPELPPYIIMEFADGGTLEDILEHRRKSNKLFSNDELKNSYKQLASGMKCINETLIHRDIKPDNILIKDDRLKIADFGLSKLAGVATRSTSFKGINHIRYCSPEAWRREKNTKAMDIYSMGIVFYELATLRFPYTIDSEGDIVEAWKDAHMFKLPEDPQKHNINLDLKLSQLIIKMISKNTQDRYKSWEDVLERIEGEIDYTKISFDVTNLVKRAIKKKTESDQRRLEEMAEKKSKREIENIVDYSFNEIENICKSIIDKFNKESEFIKLKIKKDFSTHLDISVEGVEESYKSIQISVCSVCDPYKMNGKDIRAWGYIKAPSGRGFNLILVLKDENDIYGKWKTIHVTHKPHGYKRPQPFPFEFWELPKEISILNAEHIYQRKEGVFGPNLLEPLLNELICDFKD